MIAAAGIREEESHVERSVGCVPADVRHFFEAPEDEEFFILRRIRRADCGIISASLSYLPRKYAPDLQEHIPASLFSYLEQTHGIRISRALTEPFDPATG